jgi:hypothetical protein
LLTDEQVVIGLEMIDDRNLTVHTYNEAVAEDIYSGLPAYADLLTAWLVGMEEQMKPQGSEGGEEA